MRVFGKNKIMLLFILFSLYASINSEQNSDIITRDFIDKNFELISKKENIFTSISKLINTGHLEVLEYYLNKLNLNNINYSTDLERATNIKTEKLNNVYNELKYLDETNTQKVSPAFEWYENKYNVGINIFYSNLLNTAGCFEVDDENLEVLSDKKTILYKAKCILSDYLMEFELKLDLYGKVTNSITKNKERGVTKYYIEKEIKEDWGRLLLPGHYLPENSRKYFM